MFASTPVRVRPLQGWEGSPSSDATHVSCLTFFVGPLGDKVEHDFLAEVEERVKVRVQRDQRPGQGVGRVVVHALLRSVGVNFFEFGAPATTGPSGPRVSVGR